MARVRAGTLFPVPARASDSDCEGEQMSDQPSSPAPTTRHTPRTYEFADCPLCGEAIYNSGAAWKGHFAMQHAQAAAAPLEPPRPPHDCVAIEVELERMTAERDALADDEQAAVELGGTAQPLDVERLADIIEAYETEGWKHDPDFRDGTDRQMAENIARALVRGLGAASDQRRERPEAEPQPEPWTPEEAERQFQLRNAEEDRL